MKKPVSFARAFANAFVLSGFACLFGATAAHATPVVDMWQHPSGARMALVSAPSIPMLDVRLEFDGGSRCDPPAQAGLAAAAALMSQRGLAALGTEPALAENPLAERWMDLGAQWSASASADKLGFSLRTLTADDVLPAALALAARQLASPAFVAAPSAAPSAATSAAVWQRERERWAAAWRAASTQPATVAARRFGAAVYGSHPYGQEVTPDTLAQIGLGDMAAYWQRTVRACGARVSLVGAVNRAQADAVVSALLQHLPAQACPALPPVPEVAPLDAAAEWRVPMDTAQAHVLLGQPGHARSDPDFFPLMLGNYVLGGGGFASRLMAEVREKRGLTYGVYSYFSPGNHAGAFTVGLQTRPDQADAALALVHQVVAQFVEQGPTEAELEAAKAFMVNGFALRLDTNRKLLDNVANILWVGLPPDYLQTWTAAVQAVTLADVRRAWGRVLQPQRMVSVVVGGK